MRDPKTARRDRRSRFEQRLRGRIPKPPGRAIDPARGQGRFADDEDDAPTPGRGGLVGGVVNRLGPKGRFLAAAVVIGALITAGDLFWERYTNQTAISADHANAAQVGLGHSLYDQHCAFCHGADLVGKPGWDGDYPDGGRPPLPLEGTAPIWRLSDRDLFDVIKFGGQPFSPPSYRNEMPAFEADLADADIWAIIAFIKSRWPEDVHTRQKEAAAEQGS
ncbi:c-type cytochrome [Thalassobaculum litoreum]|uniref:Cytochrome C oxidase, cbb3-type, subunit III n=1 Tax=Thalassobaculum litoreum DSM 18839 TaxID=1123362 RepID=A0A8G2BIA3_9PROT|nr:c-type cytochrome [Thalassobaculum litoreum]SDF76606.1 Cytochrome C oxidase, cbb3-type, subunit III [Thalassobaculum litoreum DSM 18839]